MLSMMPWGCVWHICLSHRSGYSRRCIDEVGLKERRGRFTRATGQGTREGYPYHTRRCWTDLSYGRGDPCGRPGKTRILWMADIIWLVFWCCFASHPFRETNPWHRIIPPEPSLL